MEGLKTWLSFEGRLSRLGYWRRNLKLLVAVAVFWGVGLMASLAVGPWAAILFLPLVPLFVAALAVIAKRLHDRNRSGWWFLIFFLLPTTLLSLVDPRATQAPAVLTGLVEMLAAIALSVWGFLEMGLRRGTSGANRFGTPPAVWG
jgi:uncharacterized membrane protein YhaH (DUF805 family)